jgi:hypothetical protein
MRRSIILMLIILTFILIIALCSSLFGLEIDDKGINLGLNYTKLWGNVQEGSDYIPGFTIGGFINKRINNWLVIQPELHLTSKIVYKDGKERLILDNDMDGLFNEDEYDLIDNDGDGLVDEDRQELEFEANGHYKLYYLEIPILFKTNSFMNSPPNFNFIFGPSFDFLLWGHYKFTQAGYSYQSKDLSGISYFSMVFFCGIEYDFGKYGLRLLINQEIFENEYKSAGEVIMQTLQENGGSVWPGMDNYSEYCKFQKVSGYGTTVTVMLSINL